MITPVASFFRGGSSSLIPSDSILRTKAAWSFTSTPKWSSTRPLVGACLVSALAKRICAPGISTAGALLRVPAFPPKVFAYQACALEISGFRQEEVNVLVFDRHRLSLVFENFDAHAVRRLHECLVEPVVVAGQHRHAGRLPLRNALLHVVDDEAHVIHHRALAAAVPGRIPERQVDAHAREQQRLCIARDRLPAHSDEDFLVGLRVFRREVPMTHGDAHLVEWGVLGVGGTGRQCRCNKEPSDYGPHESLPYVVSPLSAEHLGSWHMCGSLSAPPVRWPTLPHRPRSCTAALRSLPA